MNNLRFILCLLVLLLTACEHVGGGVARARECSLTYSPDGAHAAYFTWRGGASVEAVACNQQCAVVLELPVAGPPAYRWSAPDRVDFALQGQRRDRLLTQIGKLSVYAVPQERVRSGNFVVADISRRSCNPVENIVLEDW